MTVRGARRRRRSGPTPDARLVFTDLSWPRHRWMAIPIADEVQMTEEVGQK